MNDLQRPSGHASESDDSSYTVTATLWATGSGRFSNVICVNTQTQTVTQYAWLQC